MILNFIPASYISTHPPEDAQILAVGEEGENIIRITPTDSGILLPMFWTDVEMKADTSADKVSIAEEYVNLHHVVVMEERLHVLHAMCGMQNPFFVCVQDALPIKAISDTSVSYRRHYGLAVLSWTPENLTVLSTIDYGDTQDMNGAAWQSYIAKVNRLQQILHPDL